jgi:predicted ATPase
MTFTPVSTAAVDDGRELRERASDLEACLKRVECLWEGGGGFRIIALRGEAGIGKTSFLQRLEETALDQLPGLRIGQGAARATSTATGPFHPFRRILEDLARGAQRDRKLRDVIVAMARNYPEYLAAIPMVGSILKAAGMTERELRYGRRADADGLPRDVSQLYASLFQAIAQDDPLLLLLDDMHLSDESSVSLLAQLTDILAGSRVLAVVAYRSDDLEYRGGTHPLGITLDRLSRRVIGNLKLERLSRDGVRAVFADIKGQPPSSELLDWLIEKSEGVPYFIEEYVALLDDVDEWRTTASGLGVSPERLSRLHDIPAGIRGVLSERLRLVGSEAPEQRVLEAACVIGGAFDVEATAAVSGETLVATENALRLVCQKYGLVHADGTGVGYVFFHNLTRDFVERQLRDRNQPRYRSLHRRAAEHLVEKADDLEPAARYSLIASHYAAACLHHEAARWSLVAAKAAEELGGLAEAVARAGDAETHSRAAQNAEGRIDALAMIGRCTAELRRFRESRDALEAALELMAKADVDRRSRALIELELAKVLRMENHWEGAREALARAAGLVDQSDEETRARIGLLTGEVDLCAIPSRLDSALEALEAGAALNSSPRTAASVHGHRALALLAMGDRSGAERALASGARQAEKAHSPGARYESALFHAHLHLAVLECDEALDAVERMRLIAAEAGIGDTDVHRYAGRAHALGSDWDAAARHYRAFVRADLLLAVDHTDARDWVLTHVEEQVAELRDLHGPQAAVSFVEALSRAVTAEAEDFELLLPGLGRWISDLVAITEADGMRVALRLHEPSPAATAAFRFYMPEPWLRLRSAVRL